MRGGALLCFLLVSFFAFAGVASAATIYVPDDYATIQEAVDNASAGDTIIVRDGVYTENIEVDKPLTLISENGSENCIVRAADTHDPVFYVAADRVNISGFTIKGGYNGIRLGLAENCCITNNNVSGNRCGIRLACSSGNVVRGNTVSENERDGICLEDSCGNVVSENTVSGSGDDGIRLWYSSDNLIYLNNFIDNADNVHSAYSTNVWNSPSPVTYTYGGGQYTNYMGNYWSDYTGGDADGDGIGDTPYAIIGDADDNYPLVEPFESYFAPENQPPVASFTCSPEHPTVGQMVTFDASSSYDPDGTIVSYEWDFGDGATASGVVVTHAYSAAGNYTVTLAVTDDAGAANSTSVLITVLPPPPSVSVSTDRYEYAAGDTMLINITLRNPAGEWRHVRFLWRLAFPDYGLQFPIVNARLRLPPGYERTFTLRWRLPAWRLPFNASWYVALFDAESSELISDDRADWRYVARKGMGMVPTPAEEVMKEVKRVYPF